jgi:hypothetical protein
VSITTINNWIKQGRFQGINRQIQFKQVFIPEDSFWVSSSGKKIPISDIASGYLEELKERQARLPEEGEDREDERVRVLLEEIRYFERKYDCKFEKFQMKTPKNHTGQRDEYNWSYLLERLQGEHE